MLNFCFFDYCLFALVSFPIMARLLGPEPYGVLALADLVFGLTGIFVGAALTECLQQRETITDEQLDTTFQSCAVPAGRPRNESQA